MNKYFQSQEIQEKIAFIREEIKSCFIEVDFEPISHTYTHKRLGKFISVTTFINEFSQEFPSSMSADYSKKHGLIESEVIRLWDFQREYAGMTGTFTHDTIEYFYKNIIRYNKIKEYDKVLLDEKFVLFKNEIDYKEKFLPIDTLKQVMKINNEKIDPRDRLKTLTKYAKNYVTDNLDRLYPILVEVMVYDSSVKLSGTFDALFVFYLPQFDKFCIMIVDWKTNASFKYDNKYRKMLSPFEKYDDSHLSKYTIQTSIYRVIIEKNTKIPADWFYKDNLIVHFSEKNMNYKEIFVPYIKDDIEKMFEYRKKQLLNQPNVF